MNPAGPEVDGQACAGAAGALPAPAVPTAAASATVFGTVLSTVTRRTTRVLRIPVECPHPASHAVARLDDDHGQVLGRQDARRFEAGDARADDDHVKGAVAIRGRGGG